MTQALRRRFGSGLLLALWTVGAGAAFARVAAAIKDLAVAHRFGTQDALEAFLLAFALPIFITGTFRSAFFAAFVPRFLQAEAQGGPETARHALRRTMAIYLLLLAGIGLVLALAAAPIVSVVGREFSPDKRQSMQRFVELLSPFVVLDGVAGMFSSVLYARKRYLAAGLMPAIPPITTLAAVVGASFRLGVDALALGAVIGALLEMLVSGVLVSRLGVSILPSFARPESRDRALLQGFGLLLVGGTLMAANTVVDQAMATAAGAGSVASLSYGAKIPAAFLSLLALALSTVTLPHYATFVAERRFPEMGASLRRHVSKLVLATVALTVPLALASKPLIRLFFEHGSFLPSDTNRVAILQSLYALQIPGFIVGITASRFLNALGRDRWMLGLSCWNFLLNVSLDWLLLRAFGLPGIALSTAIVYTVAATSLLILCRKAVREESRASQTA